MAKLSKVLSKKHLQAEALVNEDRALTFDERYQVLRDWSPLASHLVGLTGIFFTPITLAREVQIESCARTPMRVLDLCAGTGRLAFQAWQSYRNGQQEDQLEIVCIEHNPEMVRIGRAILPEATWICGDVFDQATYEGLGHFDEVISNPPFGLKAQGKSWLTEAKSHYQVIEAGMRVSDYGIFILPQSACPFTYSGKQHIEYVENDSYEKWNEATGIGTSNNCGIDTTFSTEEDPFQGTGMVTELVLTENEGKPD